MKYPTHNGLPVPVREVVDFSIERKKESNNHHSCWTARKMGKLILTSTLRDLEAYQDIMPITVHDQLHDDFDPPEIDVVAAYQRVQEAFEADERLRMGSAYRPRYSALSEERMTRIEREYTQLDLRKPFIDLGAVA